MTVGRVVVAAVYWAAVTGLALTAACLVPFTGPWASLAALTGSAGICFAGAALAPSITRKART